MYIQHIHCLYNVFYIAAVYRNKQKESNSNQFTWTLNPSSLEFTTNQSRNYIPKKLKRKKVQNSKLHKILVVICKNKTNCREQSKRRKLWSISENYNGESNELKFNFVRSHESQILFEFS